MQVKQRLSKMHATHIAAARRNGNIALARRLSQNENPKKKSASVNARIGPERSHACLQNAH